MNSNRKLIDAEVLKSKIATCITVESRGKNIYENLVRFVLETVRDVIDAQPTVDAVQVIRCKDCKYGERWAPDKCYCNGFLNAWVDEDDFCAWAEPKETT